MQIFNLTTNQLIDKLIAFVTYIITFLKTTFNNIIAIRNVDFSFVNIPNSSGIIFHFILSIIYILIFITCLVFMGSIFNIIKTIIKWILFPFKLISWMIAKIIIFFIPKSSVKQKSSFNIKTSNQLVEIDKYQLNQLQRKISDLEYKLNLQKRQNVIKPVENKYQKRG